MIAEAEIENAIAIAVMAAIGQGEDQGEESLTLTSNLNLNYRIVKSWEPLPDGDVKGRGDASDAVISVAVGIRSYASFCEPQADLPCSLVIAVRREADPTGAKFAALVEPILAKLHAWNADIENVVTDLATTQFSPGGFRMTSGYRTIDETAITLPLPFTLRGVIEDVGQGTEDEEQGTGGSQSPATDD
jgi:hypothetical protein